MRRLLLAAAVLFLMPLLLSSAMAQDMVAIAHSGLAAIIEPYVTMVVYAAVVALLGWVTNLIRNWTGIQIESKQREALHSAILTGVASQIAAMGVKAVDLATSDKSKIVRSAVQYAEQSVPGALKALGPGANVLADIASSKIQLLAESAAGVQAPTSRN